MEDGGHDLCSDVDHRFPSFAMELFQKTVDLEVAL